MAAKIGRACSSSRRVFSSLVDAGAGAPPPPLAPPGQCAFGEGFTPAPLLARAQVNHDSQLLTFGLPAASSSLGLSTCACILAQSGDVVRPYTPVSTNAQQGSFDLLVKCYADGAMSKALGEVPIGDTSIAFKHIDVNVKLQYPFGKKRIGMIAGGSGITPMLQALQALIGIHGDSTEEIRLLFGNKLSEDILCRDLLEAWAARDDRFTVTHVLSEEAEEEAEEEADHLCRGFIDREMIRQHLFATPDDDTILFLCGPPPMYDALCGPRGEPEVGGVLARMGFGESHVYKF
jgi:cytochrome-b5 reductase